VGFWPSGEVKWMFIKKDFERNGVKFRGSSCQTVFHENGKLAAASLAEETEINGKRWPMQTPVSFYNDGKLYSAKLFGCDGVVEEDTTFYYTKEGNEMTNYEEFLKYFNSLDPKER
jgi:hypothetical protein